MENQCGLTGSSSGDLKINWEDIHSQRLVDSASHHVTEGRFEQARLQLEAAQRLHAGTKGIAELLAITEVCLAAIGRSCPCQSRRHEFPDWYHILKVDEKADINLIKKRYRRLALLLHPDKNTHVKAEGAFKYVAQAYDCLSDKNKRIAFNLERAKLLCRRCCVSTEARDSMPTVADTVSRSLEDEEEFDSTRGSCSGVCSPTELVWESARVQTFRRKVRARAEAAGSVSGSRVWRWNKEFEKLNIRRDDADDGRRPLLYTARRHVNEPRATYMWRNKLSREDRYTHAASMSELEVDDTGPVDVRTMPGNGNNKQTEKARVSKDLDDLLKSLKSETGEGQILNRGFAYPSFEREYSGSGFRQDLPTTSEIIKFFKQLPLTSSRPEPVDDPKNLNKQYLLKEFYFPSKKVIDSSSVQQNQEQDSNIPRPVEGSGSLGNVLPEKDLSRLDSSSLLRNLDAALADITRSAGKSDYSISTVPQSKKDRVCLPVETTLRSSSFSSKSSVQVKPPKKPLSDGRMEKVESDDQFSSPQNDDYSHSLGSKNCGVSFGCSLDDAAENPSMLITPLLRKQGRKNNIPNMESSALEKQSKGRSDIHLPDTRSFISLSPSPVLYSEIRVPEAGNCESAGQAGLTDDHTAPQTSVSDDSSSPLRVETTNKTSGLNPLLSSEKLRRWMDGLAGLSRVTQRGTQEDLKSHNLEMISSGQEGNNTAMTTIDTWWKSKDQIPSYLSKAVGTLLPDYERLWTQADGYPDPPKKSLSVTSKSDFSCNPAISLASSSRKSTLNFSCIPSLDSSTRMSSTNSSCNPASSLTSSSKSTSNFSCSPADSLPSSTRLLGSQDPLQFRDLRFLRTRQFETAATYPTAKSQDSVASEISQSPNIITFCGLDTGKDLFHSSRDYATWSNHFPWLSPRGGHRTHVGINTCMSEPNQQSGKGADSYVGNKTEQNLENNHVKSDELVATLERLRQEAKSIATALQNYNECSRIRKVTTPLPGVCSSTKNGLLPKCQSAPPSLTA